MSAARQELVDHISRRKRSAGLSDEEFAAAVGISLDELRAFELAEMPIPTEVLAVMLGLVGTSRDASHQQAPGFREDAAPPLEDATGDRFAQSVKLLRDFAVIESESQRAQILRLAATFAKHDQD